MMMYNETYDQRYQKVQEAIAFKNKYVVSTYMGQSVPPTYTDGITLAEYMEDHDRGLQCFLDFMDRLNSEAPIDCINFAYPGGHQGALTLAWLSKINMPGKELPEDAVWQVDERKRLEDGDYDLIIEAGGLGPIYDRLLPQLIDQESLNRFFKFYGEDFDAVMMKYVEAGYPVLNSGIVCPPFETLCGGRSVNVFFMDCYKQIGKVKETQDVMMSGLLEQIKAIDKKDYLIGRWIGHWRGASNMINQKIWDTLVWPYSKKLAFALLDQGVTPIMHLDSSWDRDLERFKELPYQKCILNTDGMTDLRKARKVLGDHVALMGDVPSQMLTVSSPAEIKDYVRRLLDDIGPQGVFITAGCDAPSCSKYENLVAIHEVAQEF